MTHIQESCEHLLKECHNTIANKTEYLPRPNSMPKLLKKKMIVETSRFGISPQEMEDNEKVIDRLKKKYHKKIKQISIKKTNIGDDLMTFSPDEYAKLQLMDEYQQKGLKYHENIQECSSSNCQKITAVQRLKKLAKMDGVIDEIRNNLEWGSTTHKENKIVKSHSNKKLGFQRRDPFRFSSSNLAAWKIEDPSNSKSSLRVGQSLNKYYFTVLHKKTFGKKHFLFTKYDSSVKSQEEPTLAEKIDYIKEEANRTTQQICRKKSPFMTQTRKEAIYACQVLRKAHKILKPQQFEHLQLSTAIIDGSSQESDKQNESRGEKQDESCQAQEILQKNYHRIKAERKRIIEKMIC